MLEALKSRAQESGLPWQTLAKEALQVLFLEVFYGSGEASEATFQGGTCLRLLYKGPRHSEDLDFVTQRDLGSADLAGARSSGEQPIEDGAQDRRREVVAVQP